MQRQDNMESPPVAYISPCLSEIEQQYAQVEEEVLAVKD